MKRSKRKSSVSELLDLKKKLGTLLIILICSSCGSLPSKPSIDLCAHDQPKGLVYCVNNQTGDDSTLDINDTDKYIMLSPEDWGLTLRYIRLLEQRLRNSSQKNSAMVANELRKIIVTGENLLY